MGMFDHFPYTNFHELNLDWILQALKEIEKTMDQFVLINSLKYADPIQWNIVSQYEKNTIVIDPATGTAYISVQAVPSGVQISNSDYWSKVFDLSFFITRGNKNFTAKIEDDSTIYATYELAPGDWVVWQSTLYKALTTIHIGDPYNVDLNIKHFTIEDLTGHLDNLNTTDKSNLVAAINSIITAINDRIGELDDLDTTDKSNLVAAINEVLSSLDKAIDNLNDITGSLNDLDTTAKSNLVAAINEVVSGLSTEIQNRINAISAEAQTRASADNALSTRINAIDTMSFFRNKRFLIIGDSLCDPSTMAPNWVTLFKNEVEAVNGFVDTTFCRNGASYAGMGQTATLNELDAYTDNFDYIIVALGINDYQGQWGIGSWTSTTNPDSTPGYNGYNSVAGQHKILMKLTERIPHAKIFGCIPHRYGLAANKIPLAAYRYAFGSVLQMYGARIIDWSSLPMFAPSVLGSDFAGYTSSSDTLHPSSIYAPILKDFMKEQLQIGGSNYWKNSGDQITIPIATSDGNMLITVYSDGTYVLNCAVNFNAAWSDANRVILFSGDSNVYVQTLFENAIGRYQNGTVCLTGIHTGFSVVVYNPTGISVSQLFMNYTGHVKPPMNNYSNIYD